MSDRDIDILLDQYANALYMHRKDYSPKEGVEECAVCKDVPARIRELARTSSHIPPTSPRAET